MTRDDRHALISTVELISADLSTVADLLKRILTADDAKAAEAPAELAAEPAAEPAATPAAEAEKTPAKGRTYEEARAVLAEKARMGFRAEVKAILTRHGVNQLSEIGDPEIYATVIEEASAL